MSVPQVPAAAPQVPVNAQPAQLPVRQSRVEQSCFNPENLGDRMINFLNPSDFYNPYTDIAAFSSNYFNGELCNNLSFGKVASLFIDTTLMPVKMTGRLALGIIVTLGKLLAVAVGAALALATIPLWAPVYICNKTADLNDQVQRLEHGNRVFQAYARLDQQRAERPQAQIGG